MQKRQAFFLNSRMGSDMGNLHLFIQLFFSRGNIHGFAQLNGQKTKYLFIQTKCSLYLGYEGLVSAVIIVHVISFLLLMHRIGKQPLSPWTGEENLSPMTLHGLGNAIVQLL